MTILEELIAEQIAKELKHAGVKGMKWGKRKAKAPAESITTKLKNGGALTITKDPTPAIAKLISKISPKYKENVANYHQFTLTNKEGKKVGDAYFTQDSPTSLNLGWLGVKGAHRGNGYATAAMTGVVKYAQDKGLEKLTLEVPGHSPDALHIYEKQGFVKTGMLDDGEIDPYWGGLTTMEYKLPKKTLTHADFDSSEVMEYIIRELNLMPDESEDSMAQSALSTEELITQEIVKELKHAGVKGMKWGVRKAGGSVKTSRKTPSKKTTLDNKVKRMSDADLKKKISRMQMEKQYKDLSKASVNSGQKMVNEILLNSGKQLASEYIKAGVKSGVSLAVKSVLTK